MSAPKHTPGPWKPVEFGGVQIGGGRNYEVAVCTIWDSRSKRGIANARLIAAAPELLEAAEGLASDVQCLVDCRVDCGEWGAECPLQDAHKPDGTIERLQRLLDAIAKARGGAA